MTKPQAASENGTAYEVTRVLGVTATPQVAAPDEPVDSDVVTEPVEPETSFEIAMRELEEIVSTLERGNIPLERQITLVRRGMALAAQCDVTLTRAEATLEQLVATADGELILQRVDYDEDGDTAADE